MVSTAIREQAIDGKVTSNCKRNKYILVLYDDEMDLLSFNKSSILSDYVESYVRRLCPTNNLE